MADGDYLLFQDQPGLMLVAGRGEPRARAYTWYFRHRGASGLQRIRIGRHPAVSFADACSERERMDRERRRGVDHAAERKKVRAERTAADTLRPQLEFTLAQLAKAHLAEKSATRNAKSARDLGLVLKPLTEGELADRRVAEFRPKDALELLYRIAATAPSSARALRQEMAQAHRSAALRELIPAETANVWDLCRADTVLRAKLAPSKRSRVLNDAELASWLAWLPGSKLSQLAKDALRMTLLTGARSGEVVAMRRSDVVDGKWSIAENKTDAPRTVALPLQALDLLEGRPKGEWYFASPRGGHVRQTALVLNVNLFGKASGLAHWTAHDLRRSCRTGLARLGCPREVAEAALGHSKAGIVGVYDLHRYEREVGEWLQKWADHLDALSSPSVVPMRKKA